MQSKLMYSGKFLEIYEDEHDNGKKLVKWERCSRKNNTKAVMIVPYHISKEKYLMIQEFRIPIRNYEVGFPAGLIEENENIEDTIKRELKEETGAVANKYISLGKLYPTPGYCGEVIHMYLATELAFGEQNPDEDEFLEVYKISLEDAVKMVMNGELPDSKTQTLILKINQLKSEGKI